MVLDTNLPEILRLAVSADSLAEAGVQIGHSWASQQHFVDKEVNAALDYSRSFARVFIVGAVVVLPAYFIYLMLLLAGSAGDARKLDDFRSKFWNLTKGLVVVLLGYVGINLAVSLAISISEIGNVVLFWEPTPFDWFDFSIDQILQGEVALEGETIMLQGNGEPVLCESGLETIAADAGWDYVPDLHSTGIGGCTRS